MRARLRAGPPKAPIASNSVDGYPNSWESSVMDTNLLDAPQPLAEVPADFSLVLGGPMYQLLRRSRLSDDALTMVHRRIVVGALVTWLPLLLLSAWEGRAWGNNDVIPFLLNTETHARFLVALPLLIAAELVVHLRMRGVVGQFLARGLIGDSGRSRFDAALASAMRLRNSLVAELLLVILVYGLGVVSRNYIAVDASTWAARSAAAGGSGFANLSLAGWWHALVSLPIFQFVLVRWYFRLFIWIRFLWQVSRIELQLVPMHPDRAGGLGFLGNVVFAFSVVLFAHGVLLGGMIADRIFFVGATLPQFTVEIFGAVGALVFVVLCPLMVFAGQLSRAKRAGLNIYGVLAQRYVREFDEKWLHGARDPAEPLVGTGDIQSLADLANSFDVVRTMRFVPFTKETVLQLAVVTVVPVLPLLLTMISLEELVKRLVGALF